MRRRFPVLLVGLFLLSFSADAQKSLSKCEYWIDSGVTAEADFDGEEVAFAIDASKLSEGLHTLYYRVKDSEGMYSQLQTWVFNKPAKTDMSPDIPKSLTKCEYWIDSGVTAEADFDGEEAAFAIDASKLSEGLHTLYYRVKDSEGMYSQLQTWVFNRNVISSTEAKAPKIVWFRYWWNDHIDQAVTETIDSDEAECVFERQIIVPDYAKIGENNCSARLYYVFGDDAGHVSTLEYADVEYNSKKSPVTVLAADKTVSDGSVVLTWHITAGQVYDYNVYYSEEDQPFILWLPNTTATTATFKGRAGTTYRFAVTARDRYGNRESINDGDNIKVVSN